MEVPGAGVSVCSHTVCRASRPRTGHCTVTRPGADTHLCVRGPTSLWSISFPSPSLSLPTSGPGPDEYRDLECDPLSFTGSPRAPTYGPTQSGGPVTSSVRVSDLVEGWEHPVVCGSVENSEVNAQRKRVGTTRFYLGFPVIENDWEVIVHCENFSKQGTGRRRELSPGPSVKDPTKTIEVKGNEGLIPTYLLK